MQREVDDNGSSKTAPAHDTCHGAHADQQLFCLSVMLELDIIIKSLKSGAIEVRAIIEDCRSRCLGGLAVGLEIFELAYIPALLNNSQT